MGDWRPEEMSARELLTGVSELTEAMGLYHTTLQVDTLGIAAGRASSPRRGASWASRQTHSWR